LDQTRSGEFRSWLVTDRQGLVGVIEVSTLTREVAEGLDTQTLGELVGRLAFPHVHADQGLDLALERMARANPKFFRL
jgi:CIC family chloride channel protein